jgi:outer membrane protein assembly factor BamB
MRFCLTAFLAFTAFTGLQAASEWPQWRGPEGQGHAMAAGLPVSWGAKSNVMWQVEIPGRGWSSPVVDGNLIWLTTALETAAKPELAKARLKKNTGDQPLTLLDKVELRAVAIDRVTGKLARNHLLLAVKEPQWVHQLNSYASPTPVLESGKLYAHFGALGTVCLDTASGKILWANTTLPVMHENGPGSSPVVWRNLVVFHLDGSDQQFIAALDKRTGKLAWKTPRSGAMAANPQQRKSYGTPLVITINGKEQLVSPASDWVYGYDDKGKELWKVAYGQLGYSLVPRPVAGLGMLFMSTGFGKKQILGIQLEDLPAPAIQWRYARGVPTMPSPLLVRNELYFVDDGGFLTCLDARSGEELWRERLGGNFCSSPIFADGKIYLGSREGVVSVIAPGRKFTLLGRNEMPGAIMATPAAVGNALYVRTERALWCIGGKTTGDRPLP